MSEEPVSPTHNLATTRVRRGLGVLAIACLCFAPWAPGWRRPDGGLEWLRAVLVDEDRRGSTPTSDAERYLVTMESRLTTVLALALPLGALLLVFAPRAARFRPALIGAAVANGAALTLLLRLELAGKWWPGWFRGPADDALGWLLQAFPAVATAAGLVAITLGSTRALPILRGVSYAAVPVALAVGAHRFPMWGFPALALLFALALRLEARSPAVDGDPRRAWRARAFLGVCLALMAILSSRAIWLALAPPTLDPAAAFERRARRHDGGVSALAFVGSDLLATGSEGGTIRLWSLPGGRLARDIQPEGHRVEALAFDPVARVLYSAHRLTASSGIVRAWTLEGHEARPGVSCGQLVAFSSDARRFASREGDRAVVVRSAVDGTVVLRIALVQMIVISLAFSPSGDVLVTGSSLDDGKLRLYSLPDGRLLRELESGQEVYAVTRVEVRPGGGSIAAEKNDALWLFDVAGGARVLCRRDSDISYGFSPDGELMAVAGIKQDGYRWERRLTLWRVATGELVRDVRLAEQGGDVDCVRFSLDGTRVALGCSGDMWLAGGNEDDGTVVFVPVGPR